MVITVALVLLRKRFTDYRACFFKRGLDVNLKAATPDGLPKLQTEFPLTELATSLKKIDRNAVTEGKIQGACRSVNKPEFIQYGLYRKCI